LCITASFGFAKTPVIQPPRLQGRARWTYHCSGTPSMPRHRAQGPSRSPRNIFGSQNVSAAVSCFHACHAWGSHICMHALRSCYVSRRSPSPATNTNSLFLLLAENKSQFITATSALPDDVRRRLASAHHAAFFLLASAGPLRASGAPAIPLHVAYEGKYFCWLPPPLCTIALHLCHAALSCTDMTLSHCSSGVPGGLTPLQALALGRKEVANR
jgi:hypothetical protein